MEAIKKWLFWPEPSANVSTNDGDNLTASKNKENNIDKAFVNIYTIPKNQIINNDQLKPFFDETYYEIGFNYGLNDISKDGYISGEKDLILNFQNRLGSILQEKEELIEQINMYQEIIDDTNPGIQKLLVKYLNQLNKDVEEIKRQIIISEHHEGLIKSSLNKFQIGFRNGQKKLIELGLFLNKKNNSKNNISENDSEHGEEDE